MTSHCCRRYAQNPSTSSTANGSSVSSLNEWRKTSGCASVKTSASAGHRYFWSRAICQATAAMISAQHMLVTRTPIRPASVAGTAYNAVTNGRPHTFTK